MKRLASAVIISLCSASLMHAAAGPTIHTAYVSIASLYSLPTSLNAVLGNDYAKNRTVLCLDFDQTIATPEARIRRPGDKDLVLRHLLNDELRIVDSNLYKTACAIHETFDVEETENLAVTALIRGGHFKEERDKYKKHKDDHTATVDLARGSFEDIDNALDKTLKATPNMPEEIKMAMHSAIKSALKEGYLNFAQYFRYASTTEAKVVERALQECTTYVLMEEKYALRNMLNSFYPKNDYSNGPIIGVVSAGNTNEKRAAMLKDIGINTGFWQQASNKFLGMMLLIKKVYAEDEQRIDNQMKNNDTLKKTEENCASERKHNIFILVDNNEGGVRDFIQRGKEYLTLEKDALISKLDGGLDHIKKGDGDFYIIGVHYTKTDDETTIEALDAEFREAARITPEVSSAWKFLGY